MKNGKKWVNDKRKNNGELLKVSVKNNYLKFLKSVIQYDNDKKDIDFRKILSKIEKFKDPNEIKKEKQIWTPQEFNQFISVVNSSSECSL